MVNAHATTNQPKKNFGGARVASAVAGFSSGADRKLINGIARIMDCFAHRNCYYARSRRPWQLASQGRQPAKLNAEMLLKRIDLPLECSAQLKTLGVN
jgi:hypothetical protein